MRTVIRHHGALLWTHKAYRVLRWVLHQSEYHREFIRAFSHQINPHYQYDYIHEWLMVGVTRLEGGLDILSIVVSVHTHDMAYQMCRALLNNKHLRERIMLRIVTLPTLHAWKDWLLNHSCIPSGFYPTDKQRLQHWLNTAEATVQEYWSAARHAVFPRACHSAFFCILMSTQFPRFSVPLCEELWRTHIFSHFQYQNFAPRVPLV